MKINIIVSYSCKLELDFETFSIFLIFSNRQKFKKLFKFKLIVCDLKCLENS